MPVETIAILNFGSQYDRLIARRVRELNVYSRIFPADTPADKLAKLPLKGIILTGGPASVYAPGAPACDPAVFKLPVPVLGICYGMQLACKTLGAEIKPAAGREFGRTKLNISDTTDLLKYLPPETTVWMSHGDRVHSLPDNFTALAATPNCPLAAVRSADRKFYGAQFHPEVTHTPHGMDIFKNFLYDICGCSGDWRMSDFAEQTITAVRQATGGTTVICGLSGGVDSAVTAALLQRAVADKLVCIFVDNGLLRRNERETVVTTFRDHFHIRLQVVDRSDHFLKALAGVADPQQKRKIIGAEFIEAFKSEAKKFPDAKFLAQGTLYPDVIESGGENASVAPAAQIKLHHNVGGLPAELGFDLIEPLRELFKDEVRRLGEYLGLPETIVWRHPFPGPGLAVRIIGEVTPARLKILRKADEILIEEIKAAGLYRKTSQALAVLLPVQTVGVMGDDRSYENVIAIRAVETDDFMTADFSRIPYEILALIAGRITNEIHGVNRVVYDISSKPPATIEWE